MNAEFPERRPATEEISGLIERVTFHNEENGFCVLRVKTLVGWIGLWVVFVRPNPVAIAVVAPVALGVHLFGIYLPAAASAHVAKGSRNGWVVSRLPRLV